ncbi:MAG: hypothetical protein SFW66_07990 [Gammaproteobacteria bacterium]|nr:hypothetical protein [Gammaproteobacteria bacterium]
MNYKFEKAHILLVEDDEVDIANIQRSFEKFDIKFPLVIATDGLDALNQLRGEGGYE